MSGYHRPPTSEELREAVREAYRRAKLDVPRRFLADGVDTTREPDEVERRIRELPPDQEEYMARRWAAIRSKLR